MKKIFLLLTVFTFFLAKSQDRMLISKSFKLDTLLFPGMVLSKNINPEIKATNIGNPGVITDKKLICSIFPINCKNINNLYYETYQNEETGTELGVLVAEYKKLKSLDNALNQLSASKEKGYLTKDKYLIEVWSHDEDAEQAREYLIKMENYYQNKILAKLYVTGEIYPVKVLPGE